MLSARELIPKNGKMIFDTLDIADKLIGGKLSKKSNNLQVSLDKNKRHNQTSPPYPIIGHIHIQKKQGSTHYA